MEEPSFHYSSAPTFRSDGGKGGVNKLNRRWILCRLVCFQIVLLCNKPSQELFRLRCFALEADFGRNCGKMEIV